MFSNNTTTLVEFCAGYCGIGIGLARAIPTLRTIAYCEREAFAVANMAAKIEAGFLDAAPIYADLLDFPYAEFHGLVDIAAAGIPCQPHSHAGKRKGGADERFLFDDWLKGLELMQPRYILIENVEGLLSSRMPDGTLCIGWTVERLEAMGYRVEAGIFSAEECGAPHRRKRVFILAYRNSERLQGVRECDRSQRWKEQNGYFRGSCQVWPARPGQQQYEWEPPRVVNTTNTRQCGISSDTRESNRQTKSTLGLHTNEYTDYVDGGLKNGNSDKDCAREVLQKLWEEIVSQKVWQATGGHVSVLAKEVLRSGLCMDSFTQRICFFIWCVQTGNQAKGFGLSGMWGNNTAWDTPQGQEPLEQLKRELAYALCQLSYEIALERGQSPMETAGDNVRGLWSEWENKAWDVSETLPAMEEVWRSTFDEAFRQKRIYPQATRSGRNRTDELRLLGNGVVPATAEKAWRTLYARLKS